MPINFRANEKQGVIRNLKVVLAVAYLGFIFYSISHLRGNLYVFIVSAIVLLPIFFFVILLRFLRWHLLLKALGASSSISEQFSAYMRAQPFSLFAFGGIASDAYRYIQLRQTIQPRVLIASFVIERVVAISSNLIFFFFFLDLYRHRIMLLLPELNSWIHGQDGSAALSLVVLVFFSALFLLIRAAPAFFRRASSFFLVFQRSLASTGHLLSLCLFFIASFVSSALGVLTLGLSLYCLLRLLDLPASPSFSLNAISISEAVRMIPFAFQGAGIREYTLAHALSLSHFSANIFLPASAFFYLLFTLSQVVSYVIPRIVRRRHG